MFSRFNFGVIIFVGVNLFANPPEIQWTRTFGLASYDCGWSVQQTTDGGYIIAGTTRSFGGGGFDVYLIKTAANGDLRWTKTFGGHFDERGYSVKQTTDGGYIIAGETHSFGAGLSDVYLIKVAANGNLQWTKTFGGTRYDKGYSIRQTTDGGYIIAGETHSFGADLSDVYLIKTAANGDLQWTKTFGGTSHDGGYSVKQTTDGGYIIVGYTRSFGARSRDVYIIKTDANGELQWSKTFGGNAWDEGYLVQQTTDGGYIIAGRTESFGARGSNVYIIKTDSNGDLQWTKTFGGNDWDAGHSVKQTTDGGYIIVGYTRSFGAGDYDVGLIKTDANGDLQWSKTIGGIRSDKGYSVSQTTDGGYIIAGETHSFSSGYEDVYLIKLKPAGVEERDFFARNEKLSVYPNPGFGYAIIRYLVEKTQAAIKIYDISGRLITIYPVTQEKGEYKITLNPGIYFIKLETKDFIETKKLTIL